MGMDVSGKNATSEIGSYFRNNVWWWRPLAEYCLSVAPEIASRCQYWHSNDGDGLNASDSQALAMALQAEVDNGNCAKYATEYTAELKAIPLEICNICGGSGERHDSVVDGKCNGCGGNGKRVSFEAHYPFSVENVQEFIAFLRDCGGFEIW